MGRKFFNLFYVGHKYEEEVRTQIRLVIIFTLALTIAFTWRETIFGLSKTFIQWTAGTKNTGSINFLASLFITIVSVILILLTSHYLKKKNE